MNNRPSISLLNSSLKVFCLSCLLQLTGCVKGLLYTDVTLPMTENMHNTPITITKARSSRSAIQEPLTGAGLKAEWANYAIGKTAKNNGIKTINYADLHTKSILFGLWEAKTVQVYGEKE